MSVEIYNANRNLPVTYAHYVANDGGSWTLLPQRVPAASNGGNAVFVRNETTGIRFVADVEANLGLRVRTNPPVVLFSWRTSNLVY